MRTRCQAVVMILREKDASNEEEFPKMLQFYDEINVVTLLTMIVELRQTYIRVVREKSYKLI